MTRFEQMVQGMLLALANASLHHVGELTTKEVLELYLRQAYELGLEGVPIDRDMDDHGQTALPW